MIEDLVVVLDVNAWIDCCLAVHHQEVPRPAWWRIDDNASRSQRGAALLASLESPMTADIDLVVDQALLDVVRLKLLQPRRAERRAKAGLGLSPPEAMASIDGVVERCAHRRCLVDPPAGEAYLEGHNDHEDRRVWGLFQAALGRFPDRRGWFILTDRHFRECAIRSAPTRSDGKPIYHATPPANFVRAMFHYRAVEA